MPDSPRLEPSRCFRCAYVWTSRRGPPRICPRCKSKLWDIPLLRRLPKNTGLGVDEILRPRRSEILEIAGRHKVARLRVFGSVARSAAGPKSDVDLLVEFEEGASAFDQVDLILDLQALLRRHVDAVEESGLHWYIRPQAILEAVPL